MLRDHIAGARQLRIARALRFADQRLAGCAQIAAAAVVHMRRIAVHALAVQALHQRAHIIRTALDNGAILVLIPQHQAVIAAGELLQAAAHALTLGARHEHLLHQPVHLRLGEGHKARGMVLAVLARAHLRVVIIANAVGSAAGLLGDALKYRLQRQALLLRLIRRFPQKLIFMLAPPRAAALF